MSLSIESNEQTERELLSRHFEVIKLIPTTEKYRLYLRHRYLLFDESDHSDSNEDCTTECCKGDLSTKSRTTGTLCPSVVESLPSAYFKKLWPRPLYEGCLSTREFLTSVDSHSEAVTTRTARSVIPVGVIESSLCTSPTSEVKLSTRSLRSDITSEDYYGCLSSLSLNSVLPDLEPYNPIITS